MGRHVAIEPPRTQVVDQGVEALGRLAREVAVVDLHARGDRAGGDALDVLEGEHAVGRGRTGTHAERALGVLEEFAGARQQARDVGADVDDVPPDPPEDEVLDTLPLDEPPVELELDVDPPDELVEPPDEVDEITTLPPLDPLPPKNPPAKKPPPMKPGPPPITPG